MKTAQTVSVFVAAVLSCSTVLASSHTSNSQARAQNPGIDMVITGANKGSLKLENLPPETLNKDDCPLCYHREIMKQNKTRGIGENSQPFPGE